MAGVASSGREMAQRDLISVYKYLVGGEQRQSQTVPVGAQ